MYAIVDIAGQQYKVEKNQKVFVHRLDAKEGSSVDFDKILLIDNEGKVKVGAPIVTDMIVSAKVVNHLKGDKVKVFKKKRRKGYKVLNGHRQQLTELLIEDIKAGKITKKAEAKVKSTPKKEEGTTPKTTAKKPTSVKTESDKPKTKAAPKATASDKPKAKATPKSTAVDKPKAKAAPKATASDKSKAKAATKTTAKSAATSKTDDKPKKDATAKEAKPKAAAKPKTEKKDAKDKSE